MSPTEGWRPPGGPGDSLVLGAPFLLCCPHSSGPLRLGMKINRVQNASWWVSEEADPGAACTQVRRHTQPQGSAQAPPSSANHGRGSLCHSLTPPCPPPAPSLPWLWSEEEGNASSMPAAQKGKQLSSEGKLPGSARSTFPTNILSFPGGASRSHRGSTGEGVDSDRGLVVTGCFPP